MSAAEIQLLTMPKWGLTMTKGRVVDWLIEEGTEVRPGLPLVDIETDKILSSVEATTTGRLRRKVARVGEVVHVGGLLGVIADAGISDSQIESSITEFQANYIPEKAEEEATGPMPKTVNVQGHRLCYLQRGEASEAAILIHGFGGDLNTWMFNQENLAAEHRVYALDLPGHGGSSKQVDGGGLAGFVEVLKGFTEAVGVTKAHFVGHSMGGAIAILFAMAYPERCLSLVLIDSAGLGPEIDSGYIQGFITAKRRNDLKPHLEKLFADPRAVSRQLLEDTLKFKRLDGVELALQTIASHFCHGGRQEMILCEHLSRLPVPVLVLWGAEDRILPVSHALNLPASVRTEILPRFGHMLHMEAASKVNPIIRSFWESRDA
jgi:pyruvate dehydrogenase E2 component (dihydrolipoamide acetyltransferase)